MKYFISINYNNFNFFEKKMMRYFFYKKSKIIPNKKDLEIVKNFILFYKKYYYKKTPRTHKGEWEYINKYKRNKLLKYLTQLNIIKLSEELANLFTSRISYGLFGINFDNFDKFIKSSKDLKKYICYTLKNIFVWEEFVKTSNRDYNFLNASNAGRVFGIKYKNYMIPLDIPRYDYYASRIINLLENFKKPTIIEIGGGYGGLVGQLIKRRFNFKYINIDLPETLLLSYYYLKKTTKNFFLLSNVLSTKILEKNNYILIPFKKNLELNLKADLVFNSSSFSEMPRDIINYYFDWINNKIKPKYIFHQNSNVLLFPNSKRHIEILASQFPIDKKNYSLKFSSLSLFMGGSGRYREYIYERNKKTYES